MNLKSKSVAILFIVFYMSQSVFAQEMASVTISEINLIFDHVPSTKKIVNEKSLTKNRKDESEAVYYDISDVDFFSEIDLTTNTLNITLRDIVVYDKAQLTNMETKTTVAKIELDTSNNKMNLQNIKPGKYMLILSNEAGEIRTEELAIF